MFVRLSSQSLPVSLMASVTRPLPSAGKDHPSMRVIHAPLLALGLALGMTATALAEDVACRFKADTDRTDVTIVAKGEPRWSGTIEKNETRTISIPEGPFTIHSKVYNPNLNTQGDVRTDAHTKMCREQVALSVPLFPEGSH